MKPKDDIRLVRDAGSGVEAIRARFFGHAYDLHHHDEWLVGVTDDGVQDFFCRGRRRQSTSGRVILIEPGEVHDGQAVTEGGFAYRMLYLPQALLRMPQGEGRDRDGRFRETLSDDARLGRAIRRGCDLIFGQSERLVRDAGLDRVVERLQSHLGFAPPPSAPLAAPVIAARARERLHECLDEDIGADALAREAGAADRFQLARAFRAAYGTAPHAYLVQIRLIAARRRLAAGEAPSQVAAACGFADQSHLGRRFRRAYGVTPAAYRAACTSVPDVRAPAG
ncbi:AraC family ligand binding domain-containing protein [Jiella sp. M17.18]|uniref:AraC family transcriptional regulator n=1 Tax=Jiella sp. M17.18 TaxID=3234247 RepID=UPI0034DE85CA